MNRYCGRYLRAKQFHHLNIYSEKVQDSCERNYRLRSFATIAIQQALHGFLYVVYGKCDVRCLMFEVYHIEQVQPKSNLYMKRQ
ncbi:LOW QUALITY PROTEIN: ribonuclease III domain-containing protein RNC1, chloroplastic [Cicer arietinum]|uniref:LOW QUALITY PROTEIN: ribonuclease III domain-containing protein RNC1, chloroplastic n=1 Tax=Cicer arietinum TaxID=3827 RepID=A0A1S3EFD8_CICAR|nr:LOW QUALITY PROTEIN: ribonuclease III domain-containing protein RNC1, chloroplastic [Cicer arietinum]